MRPKVTIFDRPGYEVEAVREQCRRAMEQDGLDIGGRRVFVKPSFVYPARPPLNRAVNTQPEVVGGVVRALRDLGAAEVMVGEDCLAGPSECGFLAMGVLPFMRGFADPVYLRDEERVEVKVEDALVEDSFSMPKKLMDADLFVSLPKLKVNMYAAVTLSVKNHIGLLLQAERLTNHHYNIHKKIADLYRARVPDYVIVDAVAAGEGQGPMHAEPSPLNVILAGANGVAVDAVSCRLMGFEPLEIDHLRYLHEKGLGPVDLAEIELEGAELLAERSRRLLRPVTHFEGFHHSIRFFTGHELCCPEGCLGMIRGTLDRWAQVQRWKPIKGLNFIVGKPVTDAPADLPGNKTFVIGDCAREFRHMGTFIPGCPIPPMELTYALLRKGINGPLCTRVADLARGRIMRALKIPVR